jgi:glycosyltransferase involved in cell wall biosynthesis
MSTPAVSVVIPAYNAERFLRESLDSVLRQTFSDFELIVVDDGSTDATPEILKQYARLDSRIRTHALLPNGGESAARNFGIQHSHGDLIAMMDADDICVPNRLAMQVALLRQRQDVGVVGGYVQLIDDLGRLGEVKKFPTDSALMAWSLFFVNCLAHPSVMLRKSKFLEVGGYRADFGGSIDFDLFQRLSPHVRMTNIPEVLIHYRRWSGSMSNVSSQRQQDNADKIVQEGLQALVGETISVELAFALRGLVIGAYPGSAVRISELRGVLIRLYEAFIRQPWLNAKGKSLVTKDFAIKLWLLAAVAARLSPALAVSTGAIATRVRPGSIFEFAAKALSRLP